MLEWFKRRFKQVPEARPALDPDIAMSQLRSLTSDAAFEGAFDGLDSCADRVEARVRDAIATGQLGSYPMHAARIWFAYHLGASDRELPEELVDPLSESVCWALGFDENTVLLGAALGALDSLGSGLREDVAVRVFEECGAARPRRYWLLLKVRTDRLMTAVVRALGDWNPEDLPDGSDEDFIYSPTASNRMAGAFRQFTRGDFELIERHFDLESPGAEFLVEALGATQHPTARVLLENAAADSRPAVSRVAERWLRRYDEKV